MTERRIVKIVATLTFDDPDDDELTEAVTDVEGAKQSLIENACDDCVDWTIVWSDGSEEKQ
jgi:hypothetical protein